MDFGLGLILSFTDNATAGINSAVQSLNQLTQVAENSSTALNSMADTVQLSALSTITNQIGSGLISAGSSILGVFTNLLSNVQNTGSEFESFRITLSKLYGTTDEVNEQLNKLMKFSATSPFEVSEVKDLLITLKSQGLEAFDTITGSISGASEQTLAWIGDLMSFKPEIPMQRWSIALQNYIGSGSQLVLRNLLDMGNIADIIGHDISDTVEGRMNDIVEIVESKNLTGLMESNIGTWSQTLSNVSDAWERFYLAIADSGVFDSLKQSVMGLTSVITDLSDADLGQIAKNIASGLNVLLKPVIKLASGIRNLLKGVVNMVKNNPKLTKLVTIITATSGALLLFSGVAFKVISALSSFCLTITLFKSTFGTVSSALSNGIKTLASRILPLALAIGALYLAWKTDFGGVKSIVTSFASHVSSSFNLARESVNGSVESMTATVQRLRETNDFWSGLTLAIMDVMIVARALKESWNSYTLSEDTYLKCKELGVLPLIEAILDLKYRFEFFKEGFKAGWKEVSDSIKGAVQGITGALEGTSLGSMIENIAQSVKDLKKGDTDTWYKLGENLGKIIPKAIILFATLKGADSIIGKVMRLAGALSTLSGVGSILGRLGSSIGTVFSGIGGALSRVLPVLSGGLSRVWGAISGSSIMTGLSGIFDTIVTTVYVFITDTLIPAITGALATLGAPLWAVISGAIASVLAFIMNDFETFKNIVSTVWTTIKDNAQYLWDKIKGGFTQIKDTISGAFEGIKSSISNLIDKAKELWNAFASSGVGQVVIQLLSSIGEVIVGTVVPAFNILLDIVTGVLGFIWDTIVSVVTRIIKIVKGVVTGIVDVISGVIEVITGIFTGDFSKIKEGLMTVLGGIWELIKGTFGQIIGFIGDIFSNLFDMVKHILGGIIENIVAIFNNIGDALAKWWYSVGEFIKSVFTGAIDTVKSVFGSVVSFFQAVWGGIKSVFNTVVSFFAYIFSSAWEGIKSVWNKVTGFFSGIWDGIVSVFSSVGGWFRQKFQEAVDGIKSVFSGLYGFFSGVWDSITSLFSRVGTTVGNAIKSAVTTAINTVLRGACNIINGFIKAINVAIGVINKIPGVDIGKLDLLDVPQLAEGGVVNRPTVAQIGEQGKEAIVPLENNTEWINKVAGAVVTAMSGNPPNSNINTTGLSQVVDLCVVAFSRMAQAVGGIQPQAQVSNLTPVGNNTTNNSQVNEGSNSYMTNNNNTSSNTTMDNSVTFEQGAIVIQATGSAPEDAEKLANEIMKIIKRKKELEDMTNYA